MPGGKAGRAVSGERRIITMLFCDVVDSTRMAEQLDPGEWAEIMNEAFNYLIAPIHRYEGTIARLLGDGFLAFFGAPVAHEDDPVRAVLAGLAEADGELGAAAALRREAREIIELMAGDLNEDYREAFLALPQVRQAADF